MGGSKSKPEHVRSRRIIPPQPPSLESDEASRTTLWGFEQSSRIPIRQQEKYRNHLSPEQNLYVSSSNDYYSSEIYTPQPPEFNEEWRKMPWGNMSGIEQKLRNLQLNHPNVRFVRILLIGDVGAGKSSFINSVNNAFQKRITCDALTNSAGEIRGRSFTKTYRTHYIEGQDGSILPFVFNDIMGLEVDEAGAQSQDLIRALHGLLDEGYNFKHGSSGSMPGPGYRSNPSLEDQPFCLVNIMAADKVSLMQESVINKMKKIRKEAAKHNIPQVIIMTKPDLACPLVADNIRKIYTSRKIKEKMQKCSYLLGIPMNHIFPVKNYHEEMDTDSDTDALILKALDQIVNMACDALRKTALYLGDKPVRGVRQPVPQEH